MFSLLHKFFAWQVSVSRRIDRKFFGQFAVDGNESFALLAGRVIVPGSFVADVGGGKTPFFSPNDVASRHLTVTGVDIDGEELSVAPLGAYSQKIVSALESCQGQGDHEYVIAQSVLEHVRSGREAAAGISSLLRPGGVVLTFCPNKRAWFARLNILLPERLKRRVLFSIFPEKRERQGFPAHYDGCSPAELVDNMADAGIKAEKIHYFFVSSYFMFFVPLYLFWRLATYPLMSRWPHRYCETFIFVGRKV